MKINFDRYAQIFILASMLSINFAKEISDFTGKLSASNILQILLTLSALFIIYPSLKFIISITTFLASALMSFMYNILFNSDNPKWLVLIFMVFSLSYVYYGYVLIVGKCKNKKIVDESIKQSIYLLIPIYIIMLYMQYKNGFSIDYGMDDKSHSAILLCFLSFLSLIYIKKFPFLIGLFFILMSMLTISRLPFIFAPFFIIAALINVINNSQKIINSTFKIIPIIFLLISAGYFMSENQETFKVVERLSFKSDSRSEESPSTQAHNLLIKKAIELKQLNVGNFIFGVSPGAFADTLIISPVDYLDISMLDPKFIQYAFMGKAPVHSTVFAFYSEYPIWIFIFYILVNMYIALKLFKNKNWIILLFFMPFSLATTYYSAHNKFYYFFIILVLLIQCNSKYMKKLDK